MEKVAGNDVECTLWFFLLFQRRKKEKVFFCGKGGKNMYNDK